MQETGAGGDGGRQGTAQLDFTPLANAVERLREGLALYQQGSGGDIIRDGLIQRFEFTYELCHRMLRRYLRKTSPSPDTVDQMPFQDLIRSGNAQGLLAGEWADWRRYRDMRARSSHAYGAGTAEEVVRGIPAFLQEAIHLSDALQRRQA